MAHAEPTGLVVGLQERGFDEHFPAGDDTAGLQDALDLGQHRLGVGNVHENRMAVGDVKVVVLEGKIGHVADVEGRVGMSARLGGGPGEMNL